MLSIEGLHVNYGEKEILHDISLEVGREEMVLIVGESGSGKSTLVRSIMGIMGTEGHITDGRLSFQNIQLQQLNEKQYRELRGSRIAMVFQQPERSLDPAMMIGQQFYEAMAVHQKTDKKMAEKTAKELLTMLGFQKPEELLVRYPFELSGGMCQRAAIALAVVNKPELLLADEPTSALDVVVQKQTLDLMLTMRQKMHMTLLMVTHNMGVVAYMADKVGVMHHGHLVEWGMKEEVLGNPQHPYTKELIRAIPAMNGELPEYQGIPRMTNWTHKEWYSETHWALMA